MASLICNLCNKEKPLEDFQKEKGNKNGRRNRCKICVNKKAQEWRIGFKERYKKSYMQYNYGKGLDTYYKRAYGISRIEYDTLFKLQGGKCRICGKARKRRLSVDHDHGTGEVRGLLCIRCNSLIGFCDESETTLVAAINYIRETKCHH
jgi:hypothetical protein